MTARKVDPETKNRLTPRELQVLQLLAQGHSHRIAARLLVPPVSLQTMKKHASFIISKLDCPNMVAAVTKAVAMKLIKDNTQQLNLLPVREAARLLHVHENTIRRWATDGFLPCVKIGPRGDRRFRITDIYKMLERPDYER